MPLVEALLTLLRERVGPAELSYAEAPRRLGGGFYTENHAFRLVGAPPGWGGPLVLRLFPGDGPPRLATKEASVQNALVAQGFPTPRVLLWDESTEPLGRSFLVMELLPGRALMGDPGPREFLRSSGTLLARMPRLLAETQARLHRADPAPLVDALGERAAGVDGWLDYLGSLADDGAPELGEVQRWLVENRPPAPAPSVICHGDLWPGNILAEGRRIVAVLDWTVATVAEPAFDVGFTAMALTIAPLDAPRPVVALLLRGSAVQTRRYVAAYKRLTGADLTAQPFYEALRCVLELTDVIDYRRARREGRTRERMRPSWDVASDRMVDYIRARTGVTVPVPAPG